MANVSSSNGLKKYPKLRFPEFDEPYRKCQIGDIYVERGQRGAGDMELLSVTMNDGVMPRSEIEGKDNSSEDKSNYIVVRKDYMVYNSMRMWQGANGVSNYDGIVSPAYTVLMPIEEIDNRYFAALFKTSNLINEFRKKSQGLTSDTWNLKYPQIRPIRLYIPSLREQHKISAFIDALEERIGKQRQLVDALKKYKRGAIRQILLPKSCPLKNAKWTTTRMSELGSFVKGASLSKADISEEGTPFILYGELYTTYNEVITNIKRHTQAKVDELYLSCVGDVVIPTSGETPEEISTASCVMLPGVILAGDLNIFRSSKVDGRIISYLLNHVVNAKIARIAQGKSVVHIQASELGKLTLSYPDENTQRTIIDFLSKLDEKIISEENALTFLTDLKEGLMQQLFI